MKKNPIAFKVGDKIVRKSHVSNDYFGTFVSNNLDVYPWIIEDIIPDKLWDDRKANPGDANQYVCRNLLLGHTTNFLQYEITYWKDRKDAVIAAHKLQLALLENV